MDLCEWITNVEQEIEELSLVYIHEATLDTINLNRCERLRDLSELELSEISKVA